MRKNTQVWARSHSLALKWGELISPLLLLTVRKKVVNRDIMSTLFPYGLHFSPVMIDVFRHVNMYHEDLNSMEAI